MIVDRYSGHHTKTSDPAVEAFEAAVWNFVSHRPAAGPALTKALSIDPAFTAAHALRGLANIGLARSETVSAARADLRDARLALGSRGGSASEHALVETLQFASADRFLDAAERLDRYLVGHPLDLLAIKLSHGLRFVSGDSKGMLATADAVLPAWLPSSPGYGFVIGCRAFALGENGRYEEAEAQGLAAYECESCDAWGIHAVAHVYEMQGRIDEGIGWLERTRASWTQCNNFSFHMAWHLALFYLAGGQDGQALQIYDLEVRPVSTDDFRDVANAVSFLWRLRQEKIEVGGRWRELAGIARKRAGDTTLIFASLHHLLTAVASEDNQTAAGIVQEICARADRGDGDQSDAARTVGVDLARAIVSLGAGAPAMPECGGLAKHLPLIGGSNAQRDVFLRTLALMAADVGERVQFETISAARRSLRSDDRFSGMASGRFECAARRSRSPPGSIED